MLQLRRGLVKRCSSARCSAPWVCLMSRRTPPAPIAAKLLIITDQSDVRTAIDGELDCGVEGEGVGHAGFVDDQQRRRANPSRPIW
jgi:hypothetical protein